MSMIFVGTADPSYKTVISCCEKLGIKRNEVGDMFYPEVKGEDDEKNDGN